MVLLLLLPLFLLPPLSSSAELDLDYPQEKSFSSSIVAPVQELHQLIIGEVQIILDDKHIISMIASIDPTMRIPQHIKYSFQVLPCCGKKYQQRRLVNNRACIERSTIFNIPVLRIKY